MYIKRTFLSFFKCPERLSLLHQITPSSHFPIPLFGISLHASRRYLGIDQHLRTLYLLFHWPNIFISSRYFSSSFSVISKSNALFSINCNILLSSIPVFRESKFPFKMDTSQNEIYKKLDIGKKMKKKVLLRM